MTVRELQAKLADMPPNAQVHLEVKVQGAIAGHPDRPYGHAQSVSHSEPTVVVISNRNRVPGRERS